ncbi:MULTISPECIES: hypothetical protein [unclassified Geodermatophilus]|uniref:hypothetical protein n=1 Tax=unclassified Geodermatophilus TaxID=2637632 RepID=UPI003EEE89D8
MTTLLHRAAEPEIRDVRGVQAVGGIVAAGRSRVERDGEPGRVSGVVRDGAGTGAGPLTDIVDQWGEQSFPASDPPPTW